MVNRYSVIFCFVVIFWFAAVWAEKPVEFPVLKGPYLGQKLPGTSPEVFASGVISTDRNQAYPSFTADGSEFYFRCSHRGGWFFSRRIKNVWQNPEMVPHSKEFEFGEINVIPDGSMILFCSPLKHKKSGNENKLDLWWMKRQKGKWQKPVPFPPVVNSDCHEAFATISNIKNIYFFRDCEDEKGCEIMVTSQGDHGFSTPISLGGTINTKKHEVDPYIDPDEKYLIYCVRDREGGQGNNDLYISYKLNGGGWSESFNLGDRINSPGEEITPHVSPDRKFLFFASNRNGEYDIYWVSAGFISDLKPAG